MATNNRKLPDISIHGLRQFLEADNPLGRRLIWLTLLLLGLGLSLFQIALQVRASTFAEYNMSALSELFENRPGGLHDHDMEEMMVYDLQSINWTAFYIHNAHQIQDMLIECWWRNTACDSSNFSLAVTDQGICWTFNPAPSLVYESGAQYGFRALLNTQQKEYLEGIATSGFNMMLSPGYGPLLVSKVGVVIPTGMHTHISISASEKINMKPPWGDCVDSTLRHYDVYTADACKVEIINDHVARECNCTLLYVPLAGVNVCDPVTAEVCAGPVVLNVVNSGSTQEACPPACREKVFHTYQSAAFFSSNYMLNQSFDSTVIDHADLVWIDVYYETLEKTFIEQTEAYGVPTLLCDIGGAMGLILGASVLTFAEIADHLLRLCFHCNKAITLVGHNVESNGK